MSDPIYFDSAETGAPTLNNAAGSQIAMLMACLKNGFNVKAITGIVVAAGVATVTCPAHGYSSVYGKWLKIAGANAPALDGVKKQTIVDANTFTYPAPGVADGSYTATDARRAPLGWTDAFINGGSTVAIFARTALESSAQMLRVDDQGTTATDSRVVTVESATGVDTYTGVTPALAGGYYWLKGANTATAKRWKIVGDDRGFYMAVEIGTSGYYRVHWFGDIVSFKPADAYHTMLIGATAANAGAGTAVWFTSVALGAVAATEIATVARASSQLGGGVKASLHAIGVQVVGGAGPNFPSPVENGCVISGSLFINEENVSAGHPIRGILPGAANPLAARPFADGQVVNSLLNSARQFLCAPLSSISSGQLLIDLTGPWR